MFDLRGEGPPPRGADRELDAVTDELYRLDGTGDVIATVLRGTLDQLLDGRRRGRWSYDDLLQTEKTHMGTLVEINLAREFNWDAKPTDATDYRIVDVPVDCKFSGTGGWMIGPELIGLLCLVVQANDYTSSWRMGLVRATVDNLRLGENRDKKVSLSAAGSRRVRWLWPAHGRLQENLLLHLDPAKRERIMSAKGRRKGFDGQARLNQLCREVQGRIIGRSVVETVGHGLDDPLKRMRSNGGARDQLRPEGLLVLGHQDNDPLVAGALELDIPTKGQFIVTRVVPRSPGDVRPFAQIDGHGYVVALPHEVVAPAPVVSRAGLHSRSARSRNVVGGTG